MFGDYPQMYLYELIHRVNKLQTHGNTIRSLCQDGSLNTVEQENIQMSPEIIIGILVVTLIVGIYIKRQRSDGGGGNPPAPPEIPDIPDHEAENDGDVLNGKVFSSFSSNMNGSNNSVVNVQEIEENGIVNAIMQHGSTVNEVTLGQIIKADDVNNLPVPLSSYTYKVTEVGDPLMISSPKTGNLGTSLRWKLALPTNNGRVRPLQSTVYIEIKAPTGYKSGVIVLNLRIETGA